MLEYNTITVFNCQQRISLLQIAIRTGTVSALPTPVKPHTSGILYSPGETISARIGVRSWQLFRKVGVRSCILRYEMQKNNVGY